MPMWSARQPWHETGYGLPLLVEVEAWVSMAQILRQHVNNTIFCDRTPAAWPA
ncbi:MAG: hypothetical protein ACYDBQ_09680 [Thermoplasmatota archaeon]